MKKTAIAALCIASTLILCSCSGAKKTEESQFSFNGSARVPSVSFNSEHSSKPEPDSKPDSEQSSESSIQSSAEESEVPSELPEGLTKASRGKLRFTTSVLSLSVTFSDEFCVLNEDYIASIKQSDDRYEDYCIVTTSVGAVYTVKESAETVATMCASKE